MTAKGATNRKWASTKRFRENWDRIFGNKPKQTTLCYCPACREELCANHVSLIDTDLVRYVCGNCGHKSGWDFDAPGPILREGAIP